MTVQSEEKQDETPTPEIISEEDTPFDLASVAQQGQAANSADKELSKLRSTEGLDFKKFYLGSSILGWCIFLMILCIFISIWNPDNELVQSGFEAFKLIVMTILGYIFGSNNKNS